MLSDCFQPFFIYVINIFLLQMETASELVEDDRREARQSMLDAYTSLQNMYSADDGNTEVFYLKNATATFSSFTHEPEVVKF